MKELALFLSIAFVLHHAAEGLIRLPKSRVPRCLVPHAMMYGVPFLLAMAAAGFGWLSVPAYAVIVAAHAWVDTGFPSLWLLKRFEDWPTTNTAFIEVCVDKDPKMGRKFDRVGDGLHFASLIAVGVLAAALS